MITTRTAANQGKWMVLAYQRGRSVRTEIIRLNDATPGKGTVRIDGEIATIRNDREIGPHVDADQPVTIDARTILWSQVIDEIALDEVEVFTKTLQLAENHTKKLRK